jgi:PAS domain S-box-containing protein
MRWTSTRAQTFFEGEGEARQAVRTVGAVVDVTGKMLAHEEQHKLATLVTMTHSFMGIATLEGRVTYLNPAAMTMVGLDSDEEAYKKSISDFFVESRRAQAWKEMSTQLLNTGQWEGESQFQHFQTGAPIDVEIVAFEVFDDNGAPLYIAAVSRDVTTRKRADADKAKLQEQLFQAQKMESVGRLAGGVAHDFNNMLTVINGYSRLLLGRLKTDDPLRDGLEEIRKAGEHAARLTQQLLTFSRKHIRQPSLIDLNRVVSGIRPMLTRMVGENVELSLNLNPEAMTVCADPHQLEQVVMNLAVNARDAMPRGGRIVIETTLVERGEGPAPENQSPTETAVRPVSYIVLAVSDNGVGMNEETRRRAFEPFFTTKEVGKGTGLGLSMVHGIVEQNGGCIEIDSEPGRGTTFRIYLPKAAGTATDEKAPEAALKIGGTEIVLVVEDREDVRKYAASALETYGYRVIQAGNAGEALSICERERGRIDLVLTDVVMPNLSGRELADRLRVRWPEMKILFMSGYTEDATLREGLVEGKADFIQKPFDPEQLAVKIRKVLGAPDRPARIVVADDEAGIRSFLKTVLEGGGYEVIQAVNGKQAVEKVRAGLANLVITDLVMPEQEGIETIRVLHEEAPGIRIIAMSGAFGGTLLSMARLLGADAVLSKPLTPELLLTTVSRVLKSRR